MMSHYFHSCQKWIFSWNKSSFIRYPFHFALKPCCYPFLFTKTYFSSLWKNTWGQGKASCCSVWCFYALLDLIDIIFKVLRNVFFRRQFNKKPAWSYNNIMQLINCMLFMFYCSFEPYQVAYFLIPIVYNVPWWSF